MVEVFNPGLRIGKYELTRKLAEGGFGVLFVARDTELDRDLVIKFLLPEHASNEQIVQRFLQEGRAIAKIVHPGIVTVYETGEVRNTRTAADGSAYIIMEYLVGETLAQRLKRVGRLSVSLAMEVTRQVANALQAAHEQGIVHRDLKPDNIMLVKDGALSIGERAKVLDFGIAKQAKNATIPSNYTQQGLVFGTPIYMSPEQAKSTANATASSDIYSLGCILFELLVGKTPFDGSMAELIAHHILTPPPVPSQQAPGIPPHLDQVIGAMMAKAENDRPASMKVVEAILEEKRVVASMARKRTLGGAKLITQPPPVGGAQQSPVAALAALRAAQIATAPRPPGTPPSVAVPAMPLNTPISMPVAVPPSNHDAATAVHDAASFGINAVIAANAAAGRGPAGHLAAAAHAQHDPAPTAPHAAHPGVRSGPGIAPPGPPSSFASPGSYPAPSPNPNGATHSGHMSGHDVPRKDPTGNAPHEVIKPSNPTTMNAASGMATNTPPKKSGKSGLFIGVGILAAAGVTLAVVFGGGASTSSTTTPSTQTTTGSNTTGSATGSNAIAIGSNGVTTNATTNGSGVSTGSATNTGSAAMGSGSATPEIANGAGSGSNAIAGTTSNAGSGSNASGLQSDTGSNAVVNTGSNAGAGSNAVGTGAGSSTTQMTKTVETKAPINTPEIIVTKTPETKTPVAQTPETKTPTKVVEPKTLTKVVETKTPTKVVEPKMPTKVVETKMPTKVVETKTPTKVVETKTPTKIPDTKAPSKAPDKKCTGAKCNFDGSF